MNWSYFDKFEAITDKYLPSRGEGETMATQIVTAVCKLVYKWYNDGDVYDTTHAMHGWCNNISSFANWLVSYTDSTCLFEIANAYNDEMYEAILVKLADNLLTEDKLAIYEKFAKRGSVYDCRGPFVFEEYVEDEWYDEDEE